MRILFITPYPEGVAPSQRFRFEQYLGFLLERNWEYTYLPFYDLATWNILYKKGYVFQKIWATLMGICRRVYQIWMVRSFDFVFIHREATPIGPPFFEWVVARILKKKIIYDFDDAIWIPQTSKNNWLANSLKWSSKVGLICGWAFKVSVGNKYLARYALRFNPAVVINPTTIDTENHHNLVKQFKTDTSLTLGWTGTHSTLGYLDSIVPVIKKLESIYNLKFLVICNTQPKFPLKSLQYLPWNKDNEIKDLVKIDIGLMPLIQDAWSEGKCGFKALQYMALGVPSVVSPVGVNSEIVQDGFNGFICNSAEEWYNKLETLITDADLRKTMGQNARHTILEKYSVISNKNLFLKLFR